MMAAVVVIVIVPIMTMMLIIRAVHYTFINLLAQQKKFQLKWQHK
jgi:hypothetical protein